MSELTNYEQFYREFMEQVNLARENEDLDYSDEDYFTAVMFDYLEDAGEVQDAIVNSFRDRGLQLNGYSISEDNENVYIFVSIFEKTDRVQNISAAEVDATIKRATGIFRSAIREKLYTKFQKDSDTYEFAIRLFKIRNEIQQVKIVLLTNCQVKPLLLKNIIIEKVEISFSIWDMDRLYRCFTTGKQRETIEIDLKGTYDTSIPCIENITNDIYSVYLAIMDGELLAKLYAEYGARLLERNVRSFLSIRGAVNKGIRDTLKDEPYMFLAYNNGISVTAEGVEVEHDDYGNAKITRIRDMQIVNGGQTTASIFNAKKDKKINADLSKVFVQTKITVIKSTKDMDTIVPKISAYANSQNKIQIADFSANDPFHRKLEEISRTTWTPGFSGSKPVNWFYERARGQYTDALARQGTPAKKRDYKTSHPYFTKTDLAKFINSWDQLPYQVSEGAQKNFKKFTVQIGKRIPDENYYKQLIAKAIIFKQTEKLVQLQKFGGYRANIVTYSIAFLSYKTAQCVDLERIWKEQDLTLALKNALIEISKLIHDAIINPPGGANVSEWCKKEGCWEIIRQLKYDISDLLKGELLNLAPPDHIITTNTTAVSDSLTVEEIALIEKVNSISATTWFELAKWSKETNNFLGWQRGIIFTVGTFINRGRKPSYKQAVQANKAYEEAIKKGFKV